MTGCHDTRLLLGSYALGGLEADENAVVERHLETCAECRLVHERFGSLSGMLDLVQPGPASHHQPSAPLEGSVLADYRAHPRPARRRPGRRWLRRPPLSIAVPSALAGAALAIAALTVSGGLVGGAPQTSRIELTSPTGDGGRATAQLAPTPTGTRVELDARLPALRGGEIYELWFVRPGGRVSAGTFTVDGEGKAKLRLTTAARGEGYQRVGITREPDARDPARNGPSVAIGLLRG